MFTKLEESRGSLHSSVLRPESQSQGSGSFHRCDPTGAEVTGRGNGKGPGSPGRSGLEHTLLRQSPQWRLGEECGSLRDNRRGKGTQVTLCEV